MMKTTSLLTFIVLALLFATPALAQESSRADFEDYCKAMEGRWVGNVVWVADWPGFGKKGEKVKCYAEIKIVEDGHALLGRFYGGGGSATWVSVYDAASKKIKETTVNSGGTIWESVIQKKDGNWLTTQEGSNPDGAKLKSKILTTVSDNGNKHTWSGSTTIDGKPADDLQDVWIRVSNK